MSHSQRLHPYDAEVMDADLLGVLIPRESCKPGGVLGAVDAVTGLAGVVGCGRCCGHWFSKMIEKERHDEMPRG